MRFSDNLENKVPGHTVEFFSVRKAKNFVFSGGSTSWRRLNVVAFRPDLTGEVPFGNSEINARDKYVVINLSTISFVCVS